MTETVQEVPSPEWQITMVRADALEQVWPYVVGLVDGLPEDSNGSYTVEGIVDRLLDGTWQLWVVTKGSLETTAAIVGTEVYTSMAGDKVCTLHFCKGSHAKQWTHLLRVIEDAARSIGCVKIEMTARKGWAKRLPDYRMTHVILERPL